MTAASAATSPGPAGPTPRKLFTIAVFAAVLGLIVTCSFGYADHNPRPHEVPIALVGPPQAQKQVAAALAETQPGAFRLVDVPSQEAARTSVRAQSTLGAFVLSTKGPLTILTAGAQGTLAQQVITKAGTAIAAAGHQSVRSFDVVPRTSGDQAGLGAFVFELGLLIPSIIGSVGLFLLGNRMRLWWRVAAAILFALLAACGGTLAMDTIFGTLTGNGAALIGIGFLGASSFVLFVAAVQALVGLPGTGLAALAFIFVGNAVSGGSVPVGFLPNVFRQVAPWLPNNAIIRGIRDVIYYNGHDLGHPLLVFGLWIAVAVALLLSVDALHVRARATMPHLAQEIYSTPGIVHLRSLVRGVHAHHLRPGATDRPAAADAVAAGAGIDPVVESASTPVIAPTGPVEPLGAEAVPGATALEAAVTAHMESVEAGPEAIPTHTEPAPADESPSTLETVPGASEMEAAVTAHMESVEAGPEAVPTASKPDPDPDPEPEVWPPAPRFLPRAPAPPDPPLPVAQSLTRVRVEHTDPSPAFSGLPEVPHLNGAGTHPNGDGAGPTGVPQAAEDAETGETGETGETVTFHVENGRVTLNAKDVVITAEGISIQVDRSGS